MTDLTAARVGDEVRLRWTTPGRTTDGVALKGIVVAEICRSRTGNVTGGRNASPEVLNLPEGCAPVLKVQAGPGETEAVDRLTGDLTAGSSGVIAYRVQLRGATGKTAGAGTAAYVASGAAPRGVHGLKATDAAAGAVLEWTPGDSSLDDVVELERHEEGVFGARNTKSASPRSTGESERLEGRLSGGRRSDSGTSDAGVARFTAGPGDPGGVVDRTAAVGRTYRYTAQRVRTIEVGGRSLEVRSTPAEAVTVVMRDVFPPEAPFGLVSAPGPGSIDLSWEAGLKPRGAAERETLVEGYRVYRQEVRGGEWLPLNASLIAAPAYRDVSAVAGRRYLYRVTAVDKAGHESAPSGEILEQLSE